MTHSHPEEEDCHSCESGSLCHSDESDSEGLDDDYDPNAASGAVVATKLKSTMSLKKAKSIVFPIKQTRSEKRKKLVEFSSGTEEKEEKLMDDEKDNDASI